MARASITEYRVISESSGWITEYNTREKAEQRRDELNAEFGVPDDHYVEKHTESYAV